MKAADVLFLVCVTAVAALFVAAALSHTETAATPPAVPAAPGATGRSRDLDLERVREMIERGDLSGREAEFYREAPAGPQNETASPPE